MGREMTRPTNRSELLPCPFCGGEAEVHHIFSMLFLFHTGCVVDIARHYKTKDEAISAWNTRTASAPRPDMKEALEAFRLMVDNYIAYDEFTTPYLKLVESALIRHVEGK